MSQVKNILDTANAHTSNGREDASFSCLMSMAQRELGAFMSAVTDLYGHEQAEAAAEDWIDEFESTDGMPGVAAAEWRLITIAAAARLARGLKKDGLHVTRMEESLHKSQVRTQREQKR